MSIKKVPALFVVLIVLIEVSIRLSGAVDFPLYIADNQIGYIPKPSQSGAFLWVNDWEFNSKSMGAPAFEPSDQLDLLLIGDSVVLGGNSYRMKDRLGPQLHKALNIPVWPISAGSWGLKNELIYLKIHPEVVNSIDSFVFVLNSGDFSKPSSWTCEKTHPRTRPILALLYVLKKYVFDPDGCDNIRSEFQVVDFDWKLALRDFVTDKAVQGKKVLFVMYPDKAEAGGGDALKNLNHYSLEIASLVAPYGSNFSVIDVAKITAWSDSFYKDSIHPSEEGTRVLAKIIAQSQ